MKTTMILWCDTLSLLLPIVLFTAMFVSVIGVPGPCTQREKVMACTTTGANTAVLRVSGDPGIDCVSYEILEDIAILGEYALMGWDDVCKNLPEGQAGSYEIKHQQEDTTVFNCTGSTGDTRLVLYQSDFPDAKCSRISIKVDVDPIVCTSTNASSSTVAGFDYGVFSATVRADCEARAWRDEAAEYGMQWILEQVNTNKGSRRLDYPSNCPGASVKRTTNYFIVSRYDSDKSWHWHLYADGTGTRGLWFDNPVVNLGAMPCQTTTCTSSSTLSCWPRPRYSPGRHSGQTTAYQYLCTDVVKSNWHLSGYFRGSMTLAGDSVSGSTTSCSVTSAGNGRWRLEALTLSWCDIYVYQDSGSYLLSESLVKKNVCHRDWKQRPIG